MSPEQSGDYQRNLAALRERIVAFAASRVGRDRAEDIAQEALMLMHTKYAHVTDQIEMIKVGLKISAYKFMEAIRPSRTVDTPVDELPIEAKEDDPVRILMRKELSGHLREVLLTLSPRCRQMFLLRMDGMSFPQIQQIMGQSKINTIYTWDLRCRKHAQELLQQRFKEML